MQLEYRSPTYYVLSDTAVGDVLNAQVGVEGEAVRVVALSRVAIDEDTGEALLAAGEPTEESLARLAASVPNFPQDALLAEGIDPIGLLKPEPIWYSRHGFFATFWMDPLGLTVSDAIDEGRWEYDGTYVRNKWGDDGTYWFDLNGWHQVSHSWGTYYNAPRTWMTVWTDARGQTSCGFPPLNCGTTHIYYDANNFYGGGDGTRSGGVNTWATGSCASLLTYEAMVLQGT
jgi:hypothetical protein